MENETIKFLLRSINRVKDLEMRGAILDLIDQYESLEKQHTSDMNEILSSLQQVYIKHLNHE